MIARSTATSAALFDVAPAAPCAAAPSAWSARVTRARSAPGRSAHRQRRRRGRVSPQQGGGGNVGDAALLLKRAHDAGDAEAEFLPEGQLQRERLSDAEAERLGEALPDIGLMPAARAMAGEQRRRLEGRGVAGIRDRVDGLPEREGVSRLQLIPRSGGLHTRDPAHRPGVTRGQGGGELVAATERPGVGLQRVQLGCEREQQQHEGRRQTERDHRREQPGAAGGDQATSEEGESRGRRPALTRRHVTAEPGAPSRYRLPAPAADVGPAQQRDDRPGVRTPCRPRRAAHSDRDRDQPPGDDGG